jgi:predicted O-linked N-acetylglucosamine transferase (SPINDLY family)
MSKDLGITQQKKLVISLRFGNRFSIEETARIMGKNINTVKALKHKLEKYEKDDPEIALMISEKALKVQPDNEMFLNKNKELSKQIADAKKENMTPLYNGTDLSDWEVPPILGIETML